MNWNDSLYWYWRERGGDFFASALYMDSGVLFLDVPHGPAFIQCGETTFYNGQARREIAVTLRACLERSCYLTVRKETFSWRGEGGGGPQPPSEDGVPEVAARRNVRASEPGFASQVLQSRRLQALLRAEPGAWLQISPLQAGALEHLVSVRKDAEHLEESLDSQGQAAGRDVPNQCKLYAESGFREQMDGLVEMARMARDGANLWQRRGREPGHGREDGV